VHEEPTPVLVMLMVKKTAQTRWNHLFVTFPRCQGYKGRLWNCVCCIVISLWARSSQGTWKQEDPASFSVKSWKRTEHFSIWSKTYSAQTAFQITTDTCDINILYV